MSSDDPPSFPYFCLSTVPATVCKITFFLDLFMKNLSHQPQNNGDKPVPDGDPTLLLQLDLYLLCQSQVWFNPLRY